MADKQRFTTGQSHENRQNVDNERSPEENKDNAGVSRNLPDTSGGIVQAHGNQPDGPLEESPNCPDNQPVAGSSNLNVVNSQGPVQLGAGAAVIHNPTYNNYNNCNNQQQHHHHHYHPPSHITSPDQYFQWMEQIKAAALRSSATPPRLPHCPVSQHPVVENTTDRAQTHSTSTVYSSHHGSFHVPCHCPECLSYHQREHRPLAGMPGLETLSRDSGQTQHQHLPQLLPSSENREQKSSTNEDKQHQETSVKPKQCPGSHRSPQSSPSDVSHDVTRTEQAAEGQGQTTEAVRSPPDNCPVSRDSIPDSVCIIDSAGRSLEPGDSVRFMRNGYWRYGIYVGGQQVVWCEESGHCLLVHKGQLQLTNPFQKVIVINQLGVRVFLPGERVQRAESLVRTQFMEGDRSDGSDFPVWVYTGSGENQAWSRGFGLWY